MSVRTICLCTYILPSLNVKPTVFYPLPLLQKMNDVSLRQTAILETNSHREEVFGIDVIHRLIKLDMQVITVYHAGKGQCVLLLY